MDGFSSIEDVILTVLAIFIILILIGTIYSIIRAIIQFIFSNGDNEKIKKAWNGIRYTIIGMIITIVLLFIFPIIFQKIGLQGWKAYTANAILERAMLLGKKILRMWTDTSSGNPWSLDNGTSIDSSL
jgi:uncharacterized BrkB/YihY/UPF0761 family membrane protein